MIELKVIESEPTALDVVMSTGIPINNQDKTVTPTEEAQTVTADAGYTGLGTVTVEAIDGEYVGSEVTRRSAADLSASGPTVTAPAGYYENDASKTVSSGTEGTPTAEKGTVSGHAVTVTPRVTNSAGYISGGTKTGSAVTVEASELVSGTKEITANGTDIDVTEYEKVNVAVPGPSGTKNITVTQNGTTTENVSGYASAEITANVPNTYSASDEGKVVSSGALVAQTSDTVTANDTYDTTLINSLTVNVSGGGGLDYNDVATHNVGDGTLRLTASAIPSYTFRGWGFTNIVAPNVSSIGQQGLANNAFTTVFFSHKTSIGQDAFNNNSSMVTMVFAGGISGFAYGSIREMTNLEKLDIGSDTTTSIVSNAIVSCTKLNTIVIRKSSVVALANVNSLNATAFASSRAGGILYVPNDLIASYQSASNWSTILGYANNQIKSIESTHTDPTAPIDLTLYYLDGTPIST